jgi:hypothetical protein
MLHRGSDDGLLWLESNGGPLLLLDQSWLPAWNGYSDAALPVDAPGTDYARACAVDDYLGLLTIGFGAGLVLGDEPLMTAWWPSFDQPGGTLIRWRWANDEAVWRDALSRLASLPWSNPSVVLPVPTGHAVLFDAADPGWDIKESLTLELAPGTYEVDTAEYQPDEETAFLLHRLTLYRLETRLDGEVLVHSF